MAFVIGIVVGAAVTLLIVIVVAPSRRVRAEAPLPMETQLRLLLGLNPEIPPTADGVEATVVAETPSPDWQFNTSQMQSLRDLEGAEINEANVRPEGPGNPDAIPG